MAHTNISLNHACSFSLKLVPNFWTIISKYDFIAVLSNVSEFPIFFDIFSTSFVNSASNSTLVSVALGVLGVLEIGVLGVLGGLGDWGMGVLGVFDSKVCSTIRCPIYKFILCEIH